MMVRISSKYRAWRFVQILLLSFVALPLWQNCIVFERDWWRCLAFASASHSKTTDWSWTFDTCYDCFITLSVSSIVIKDRIILSSFLHKLLENFFFLLLLNRHTQASLHGVFDSSFLVPLLLKSFKIVCVETRVMVVKLWVGYFLLKKLLLCYQRRHL